MKKLIQICENCTHFSRLFDPDAEKNGEVHCSKDYGLIQTKRYFTFIYQYGPPEDCPYKMEHKILLQNMYGKK